MNHCPLTHLLNVNAALPYQKAVAAYLECKQLLPFGFNDRVATTKLFSTIAALVRPGNMVWAFMRAPLPWTSHRKLVKPALEVTTNPTRNNDFKFNLVTV